MELNKNDASIGRATWRMSINFNIQEYFGGYFGTTIRHEWYCFLQDQRNFLLLCELLWDTVHSLEMNS